MFLNEYSCSEEKKARFVKYLEKHGVTQKFAEIFDKLMKMKDRPENAMDFIRQELGDHIVSDEKIENLERELEETLDEIARLQNAIKELDLKENSVNENDGQEVDAGSSEIGQ